MEELLEYDIESIFLNRVRDVFPFHQRIISACDSFFNGVSNSVKKERAQKHGMVILFVYIRGSDFIKKFL